MAEKTNSYKGSKYLICFNLTNKCIEIISLELKTSLNERKVQK